MSAIGNFWYRLVCRQLKIFNELFRLQGLPRVTVFLEQVVSSLPDWSASLQPFPVVSWPQFVEYLHNVVNPLAGEEHLKEVIQQLQLMGD